MSINSNIQYSTIPECCSVGTDSFNIFEFIDSKSTVLEFEEISTTYPNFEITEALSWAMEKNNTHLIEHIVKIGRESIFLHSTTHIILTSNEKLIYELGGKTLFIEGGIEFTPLHLACTTNYENSCALAKKLLFLGSPVNIISNEPIPLAKLTPLDVVINYGKEEEYLDIAILLLRKGGVALENHDLDRLKKAKCNIMTYNEKALAIHFNQHNPNQVPKELITKIFLLSLELDLQG